jgi:hypothetical protein
VGVVEDPIAGYLSGLTPAVREVAEHLIVIVRRRSKLNSAIKWRQLTFALDGDFDHWICAVAGTSRQARLTFHFGALLDDVAGVFAPSDAKYVRRITFTSGGDVDEAIVADLLSQALDTLPRFRQQGRSG